MKSILLMVAVLILTASLADAGLKSEAEIRKHADSILEKVVKNKLKEAFDLSKQNWPIPAEEIDNLRYQTETQLKSVSSRFGKMLSKEFILEEKIGNSFVRYQYIVKFEKHAIRWMFIFYKPKSEWILNHMSWDDSIQLLFKK